ncbi:MAG TPA: ATP synthase subunit I [Terriglobia bacterium]|nr:ATP synthase subunit I [Terriglobia bacterium]
MTESELAKIQRRMPRWMVAILVVVCATFVVRGEWRFSLGLVVGAVAGILNYLWLYEAVESMFSAGQSKVPRPILIKMVLRYPLVFGGVLFFYWTGWLPFSGVIAGLFVPVGGMMLEGGLQAVIYLFGKDPVSAYKGTPATGHGPAGKDPN